MSRFHGRGNFETHLTFMKINHPRFIAQNKEKKPFLLDKSKRIQKVKLQKVKVNLSLQKGNSLILTAVLKEAYIILNT